MTNQSLLPVTQKDREAYLSLNMLPPEDADAVRAGKWDGVTGVQAFARHRLDHTAPADVALRWEGDMLCVGGVKVGEVWRAIHQFGWVVSLDAKEVQGFAPNKAEARAAAEQAVRDWLARAGLYTGPNDCGAGHPNAAWSEAEPEQHIERTERDG